jgi:thiamine biosynthesis lipoprotein
MFEAFQLTEHGDLTRRDFLKISGIVGLGMTTCPIMAPIAEAVKFDKDLYKVSRSRVAMGTIVSMTVLDPSKDRADGAIDLAFQEIERLSGLMSRHDARTPLSHLNRMQVLKDAPPELLFVIEKSLYYHRMSDGFFDITVKPVLDLLEKLGKNSRAVFQTEAEIAQLLKLVDARQISIDGKTVFLKREGMGITLDGIAKGFIVDKAMEQLMQHGIQHALLNAGGDIRTLGDKGNNRPWKVAIEDPLKKGNYPDTVALTNGSIATSGNYEVFFDQEKIFHHIINPKIGVSPPINASVSVTAPTTMEADALSTTLFVLGPSQGLRLINTMPQCESLTVTGNQNKIKSKGWRGLRLS